MCRRLKKKENQRSCGIYCERTHLLQGVHPCLPHLVCEAAGCVEMHVGGVSARACDAAVVPMCDAVYDL